MLGALGADVLRIDLPGRPELKLHQYDGLLAKRSPLLDLADQHLQELLARADVVVTGYRPGALDRFGLSPNMMADRHPGLVVVTLSAWGSTPGFAERRDSLSAAASTHSSKPPRESPSPTGTPARCPANCSTTPRAISSQPPPWKASPASAQAGGTHIAHLSLTATAEDLLRRARVADSDVDPAPYLIDLDPHVTAVAPPGRLGC